MFGLGRHNWNEVVAVFAIAACVRALGFGANDCFISAIGRLACPTGNRYQLERYRFEREPGILVVPVSDTIAGTPERSGSRARRLLARWRRPEYSRRNRV